MVGGRRSDDRVAAAADDAGGDGDQLAAQAAQVGGMPGAVIETAEFS